MLCVEWEHQMTPITKSCTCCSHRKYFHIVQNFAFKLTHSFDSQYTNVHKTFHHVLTCFFEDMLVLLRSEIPSGICAKLRTVAASNNRDHSCLAISLRVR